MTTGAGFNDGNYSNEKIDELLNSARTISNPQERAALYQEAMGIVAQDRPLIYLYHLGWLYGIDEKVQGLTLYPDGMLRLEGVSLEN